MGSFQFLSWHAQNHLKFCGCNIWDHLNFGRDMAKRSQILRLQNMGPFQLLSKHGNTVSNCDWKILDHINFCPDVAKRSRILRLRNMGPFQFLSWHGKTVSNFAAAKYETISIFVVTWQNGFKFCSCKIWNHFNFCLLQNGLKFHGCKIWDRFNFCHDVTKRSQILQLQNIGLFQFLLWRGETVSNFAAANYGTISIFDMTCWNSLKFCNCEILDRFNFWPDVVKRSWILWLWNMGPFQFLSWHDETVSNLAAMKYGTISIFVLTWQNCLKFCGCKIWDRFEFFLLAQFTLMII